MATWKEPSSSGFVKESGDCTRPLGRGLSSPLETLFRRMMGLGKYASSTDDAPLLRGFSGNLRRAITEARPRSEQAVTPQEAPDVFLSASLTFSTQS